MHISGKGGYGEHQVAQKPKTSTIRASRQPLRDKVLPAAGSLETKGRTHCKVPDPTMVSRHTDFDVDRTFRTKMFVADLVHYTVFNRLAAFLAIAEQAYFFSI
jgi:hypothetical protein